MPVQVVRCAYCWCNNRGVIMSTCICKGQDKCATVSGHFHSGSMGYCIENGILAHRYANTINMTECLAHSMS